MRLFQRNALAILALATLLGTGAPRASAQATAPDPDAKLLEGTWTVQVTQRNCISGAPIGNPFLSYLTFAQGGTLVETTANPNFFPAVRGPGHGVWGHSHARTFNAASTAFITLNGALVKTQVINQIIEVNSPDDFTTVAAKVQFFSPAGTLLLSGCATATGKRFTLGG